MSRSPVGVVGLLAVALLAACGGSNTGSNTNSSNTPVAKTSSSPSTAASAAATTVDPCQVVTQSEASQLAGASFAAGKEDTTSGGKICWYGAQTTNVFEVVVAQAASASAAQSQWDQYKSQVQAALQQVTASSGVTVNINTSDTSISGADRAAAGTFSSSGSGYTLAGTAVYLLKGATFFAIVDIVLNHPAPTTSAMESQAQTSLRRLP